MRGREKGMTRDREINRERKREGGREGPSVGKVLQLMNFPTFTGNRMEEKCYCFHVLNQIYNTEAI